MCLPTCWSWWWQHMSFTLRSCGVRRTKSIVCCCLRKTGAAYWARLFLSNSCSVFVLSRVFEGIMNINKIFLWTEFPDILDSKQVLAPGSVFTCSLWGNIRVQMKANHFSRVCCVPFLLSFAPASFPSHPSWPAPPPLLPRSKLSVLTAHILEEEEQTRDICGKWDYETGLTRPLLTPAMVHDTVQVIVTECKFGFIFWTLAFQLPGFRLRGWDVWFFYWYSSHVQWDMSGRCCSRTPCFENHLEHLFGCIT